MKCPNCLKNVPSGTKICPICAFSFDDSKAKPSQKPKESSLNFSSSLSFSKTKSTENAIEHKDTDSVHDIKQSSPVLEQDIKQEPVQPPVEKPDDEDNATYSDQSLVALKALCSERFIPIDDNFKKDDIIDLLTMYDSIYDELMECSLQELRNRCDGYSIDYSPRSNKTELISSIVAYIMNNGDSTDENIDNEDTDEEIEPVDVEEELNDVEEEIIDSETKDELWKETSEEPTEHPSFSELEQKNAKFNPNSDGYYDDVLPEIMDRIEKISSQNVLRIIAIGGGFVAAVLVLIFTI